MVQMQQSHSSSPQSQPKHGFWTDLMGFLIEDPELVDGRIKFRGEEIEEAPILTKASEDQQRVHCVGLKRATSAVQAAKF
ncbi:hypothetical protein ETB97_004663 [Aspergillus alliaceus]|uniref:Uncharacterized protein n=1 Tax=Petromyces alliaceus TaxID=209559 RepID=A0A8H6E3L6_PETAA|nr:hypothetical protein ETB97_004663 [Aspergillus burnettii]